SITSFFYESMAMNPSIWQCGSQPCTEEDTRERLSLLLKSISGIAPALQGLPEAQALTYFKDLVENLKQDISKITSVNPIEVRDQILVILKRAGALRDLINPELTTYLSSNASIPYRIEQVKATISSFGNFEATDEVILNRPGLFNFTKVAQLIGRMGSFYASYPPASQEAWQDFFIQCAGQSRGKLWNELPSTCQSKFTKMMLGFYKEAPGRNRADDTVGDSVGTYIVTAASNDPSTLERLKASKNGFISGSPKPVGKIFDQVQFAYWGPTADLERGAIKAKNPPLNTNPHWQKYLGLRANTWETALRTSPAEPGLANLQYFLDGDKETVSFGGWGNLFPSQLLKVVTGCEDVYFITRIGETAFDSDMSRLLGIDAAAAKNLYDMRNPESSVRQSIATSDHVICANWDAVPLNGLSAVEDLIREGYSKKAFSRQSPSTEYGCF
ncbi:MAG: hypothetical protein NTX25_10475, partial [Proteobacteria bacterium]|nr:hypothetical protein [Pseudomonadota bacterium]